MDKLTKQVVYHGSLTDVARGHKNRSFQSATLRLMAVDVIANKTRYSKEAILKALPTLCNIPLVGRWKGQDFGGHESRLELDEDEGYKMAYHTTPLGVIPESANFWFETVNVEGKEREFLCVDVLLWKRQKEVKQLIKRKQFSVSMEVTITNADKDLRGVLEIRDFYFTAVCVLGSNITPAFSGAMVQTYEEDRTQAQINQMMLEFAKELGGETVADDIKKVVTDEEEEKEVIEETTDESEETKTDETKTSETDETKQTEEESPSEEDKKEDEQEEFACDPKDDEEEKACEADTQAEEPVKEDQPEDKEEASELERLKTDYQNVVDALMIKTREVEDLQAELDALKAESEDLKAFKADVLAERRQQEEEELFNKFSDLKESPEFEELKAKAKDYSIEALETQLYALMGRKLYSEQKPAISTHVAYELNYQSTQPVDSVFNLLDTYLKGATR